MCIDSDDDEDDDDDLEILSVIKPTEETVKQVK